MVTIVEINGFEEFTNYIDELPEDAPQAYFYFTASKLPDGKSWCPDCNEAEPVVKAYLRELNKTVIFGFVDVGNMSYWKDKACPFRTDNRTRLMTIPTIIKWKGVQRLEGSQCNKRELLQMLFEEEEG